MNKDRLQHLSKGSRRNYLDDVGSIRNNKLAADDRGSKQCSSINPCQIERIDRCTDSRE